MTCYPAPLERICTYQKQGGSAMDRDYKNTSERVRKQYPIGCRVELLRMNDPQASPIGTKGTVV